jgi:hypothetical protein
MNTTLAITHTTIGIALAAGCIWGLTQLALTIRDHYRRR